MEAVAEYQRKFSIEDNAKQINLSSLFNYFQGIAIKHADNLGVGIETMAQMGLGWALIRMRVDVTRYPAPDEEILIETWYLEPKKFEFERDFVVYDTHGNIIAKAVSSWIIFDMQTRELRKSSLVAAEFPPSTGQRAIDCKLGKLKAFGQPEIVYKKTITHQDIDFNGHLNNTSYVDYVLDCLAVDNHKADFVKTMEINYINEALPEDTIMFWRDISTSNSNLIYFEGINEKDIRDALIKLGPKAKELQTNSILKKLEVKTRKQAVQRYKL